MLLPDQPSELLRQALDGLAARTGMPVAFGGLAGPAGAVLTSFVGARTGTLQGLLVEPGEGLGGLALARGRRAAASSYRASRAITHRYDPQVGGEGIVSLLAVPVVLGAEVRAVLYAGHRTVTRFGDTVLDAAQECARRLAWDLAVHEEVQRRLAASGAHAAGCREGIGERERTELAAVHAELRQIARSIPDPALAARLEAAGKVMGRLGRAPRAGAGDGSGRLSPRELDVLAHLALGKRNALIGAHLGVAESTVKSYLASAMRKLQARSRHEAVVAARRRGLIP